MDNTVCFSIMGKNLILDHVLVEYNGIPIFFVCKNGEEYYVCLCIDTGIFDYYVVKIPFSRLYAMLFGKISMRDVFMLSKTFWLIHSGEEVDADVVIKLKTTDINTMVLPDEGALFEILDSDVQAYADGIRQRFYDPDDFEHTISIDVPIENCWLEIQNQEIKQYINLESRVIKSNVPLTINSNDEHYSESLQSLVHPIITSSITEESLYNTYTPQATARDLAA